MAVLSPAESRLRQVADELAQRVASGRITPDQLREAMRRALAFAHTQAILRGTGGERPPEIEAALRDILNTEYAELDRLIALAGQSDFDAQEWTQRLEAFADTLDETQAEGERLTPQGVNPLVPAAIGGALGLLLSRDRVTVPRLDSRQVSALYQQLLRETDAISAQYQGGQLTLDQWYELMQRQVTNAHARLARIGKGAPLDAADFDRLNARIQGQWEYLNNWRDELRSGMIFRDDRARLYVNAGKSSLQEAFAAQIGLPPMPVYPGERSECQTNCKCTWRYERLPGNGNWNCTWILRPAEHCPNCMARADLWNPIQVRGGVLGPYSTIGVFA